MTTDLELVQACQASYSNPASVYNTKTGVYICLSQASDGNTVIAFRGSITPRDWFRDFNTLSIACKTDPQLGFCHAGFLDACVSVIHTLSSIKEPFYITGHSLGGAEAVGVATLLNDLYQLKATKVVTFGAPRFGGYRFRKHSNALDIVQYRYGNDPVPTVPRFVWPFFIFVNTRPQTPVDEKRDDAFSCHHIENYVGALTQLQ